MAQKSYEGASPGHQEQLNVWPGWISGLALYKANFGELIAQW